MNGPAFLVGVPLGKPRTAHKRMVAARRPVRATQGRDDDSDTDTANRKRLEDTLANTSDDAKASQRSCIRCDGTKERDCPWCESKGFRYEIVGTDWTQLDKALDTMTAGDLLPTPNRSKVPCSVCKGTTKIRCGYCHGSGVGTYGRAQ